MGAALAALVATLCGCMTSEGTGFVIDPDAVSCVADDRSGLSVLEIPLTVRPSLQFEPDLLRVELDSPQGVSFEGAGLAESTPGFVPGEPINAQTLELLASQRDVTMLYLPIERGGTHTLLVLLEPTGPAPRTIESLRIFWGGGEPIYWQVLPVAMSVGDSCTVTATAPTAD